LKVTKTYFMVMVSDMDRALAFYQAAFGLKLRYSSSEWSELGGRDAVVALHAGRAGGPADIGLGFEVTDLEEACAAVKAAGGSIVKPPIEREGEGIRLAIVSDPEDNRLSLAQPVAS
jgi:predicted enzyme related to lactoylglutathione lyase